MIKIVENFNEYVYDRNKHFLILCEVCHKFVVADKKDFVYDKSYLKATCKLPCPQCGGEISIES